MNTYNYHSRLEDWGAQALGELSGFCMGWERFETHDYRKFLVACERCGFAVGKAISLLLAEAAVGVDLFKETEAIALDEFRKHAKIIGCIHEQDAEEYKRNHGRVLEYLAMLKERNAS